MIKSRIAPTPSGLLHRGNALNFLLTSALVAEGRGELRLRIDDLDAPRVRTAYLDDIFETLRWLGIHWSQGPMDVADHVANYRQELRLSLYENLLDQLVTTGQVFACTCSRKALAAASQDGQYPGTCRFKNLPLNTPDASWRMITPENIFIHFQDAFLGKLSINLFDQARDFVIRRRDGLPAYHIASLADDVQYGINTIVRGEDLLLSTAVQLYLTQLLQLTDFETVKFYHHPLIKDDMGAKLSKSAGSTSMHHLRQSGLTGKNFRTEFEHWRSLIK